jgi:hypothetical protein
VVPAQMGNKDVDQRRTSFVLLQHVHSRKVWISVLNVKNSRVKRPNWDQLNMNIVNTSQLKKYKEKNS